MAKDGVEVSPWRELARIAAGGGTSVPMPGSGATAIRFAALADWAARDLSLGRLVEGHLDALAILDEAGRRPVEGAIYGVWAARPPADGTSARLTDDGWHLEGTKPFCSGSRRLDRALVTAESPDGYRLFEISVPDHVVGVREGSWPAVGMAESLSETLRFGGPPLARRNEIGPPGFYLDRPGFWFGATGVAACWYGGARGLFEHAVREASRGVVDLTAAELGHALAHVETMRHTIEQAAREIDEDPLDHSRAAQRRALLVRHAVHHGAQQVLRHVVAAGGARSLCHDAAQSRRAADLTVYLAQLHGPHDAATLGKMACEAWPWR